MPDFFRDTTALITGASRGIGAAFAGLLAVRGSHLVLVGRRAETLEPVAEQARRFGVRVSVIPADLEQPDAPRHIAAATERAGIVVDLLINNAGQGPQGRFQDLPAGWHLATLDVNARAVVALSAHFLPGMLERRRGGLLNVASTAGWQGLKWMPVYSGSKAFLVNWSEAVWVGLRGTGVRCCCLSPGPVDTPFFEHNKIAIKLPRWAMQTPETVARAGLKGYQHDDCHVLPFLPFRLAAWSTRLVPRVIAARLGAGYAKPLSGPEG